jgi:mannan endo-1,4-beta-mannosidase
MKIIKKLTAFTAAVSIAFFTGCDTVGRIDVTDVSSSEDLTSDETGTASASEISGTEAAESYPDYPISYPEIQQQDTSDLYEAEDCVLGGLTVSDELENFSGTGYVTGFSSDAASSIEFNVTIPSNQHYDLSFCIASDSVVQCTVYLDDSEIKSFNTITTDDGAFAIITVQGVFIENGNANIKLSADDGDIKLDYLKVSNNTSLEEISYSTSGELSNADAADSAKQLMHFLSEYYGKYIITGQYVSDTSNSELELIYKTTGKYPVIRFSALRNTNGVLGDCTDEIDAMSDWYDKGGIVGLMWYWECPGELPSVYADNTDFDLSNAVTDEDIAELSQGEIMELYNNGVISEECYELIVDIDEMSQQLLKLKEKGIPVLWRPLHEGSGNWFWWGASGEDAYKWLWKLVYTRMTNYFELDNLIWVWNGQSAGTLVDKSTFDIAAMDIYLGEGKEMESCYDQFAALQKLVGSDKLIALSECSGVPDMDMSFRDNAVWSFFGLWYGSYLKNDLGIDDYGTEQDPEAKEKFIRAYNSSGALTLDEYKKMQESTSESVTEAQTEAESETEAVTEAETQAE